MTDENELNDDQVNAVFADLEKQFDADFGKELDDNLTDHYSLDPHFDEELAGLLGSKAKIAILITQIVDAKFLAALCCICDIDALSVGFPTGAGAIMHKTDGQAPEEAARDLSDVMAGLSVIACVNRADKISATHWYDGKQAQDFAPPMLFASLDSSIEDLMIGAQTVDDMDVLGYPHVESSSFASHDEALTYIRTLMTPRAGTSYDGDDAER
ncbi:hypothetical protein ACFQY8_05420 [Alloscardovia venturai]|uniref:Uncharacterized protein n=1 Tax=Alloscardovia venturai TaxID=1769421 RepID=A0ABW2Y5Z6_9BIFI